MSIVYRIDKEKGCTLVLWDGVVTADEFLAHVRRLSSNADWPPPTYFQALPCEVFPWLNPETTWDEVAAVLASLVYQQLIDRFRALAGARGKKPPSAWRTLHYYCADMAMTIFCREGTD